MKSSSRLRSFVGRGSEGGDNVVAGGSGGEGGGVTTPPPSHWLALGGAGGLWLVSSGTRGDSILEETFRCGGASSRSGVWLIHAPAIDFFSGASASALDKEAAPPRLPDSVLRSVLQLVLRLRRLDERRPDEKPDGSMRDGAGGPGPLSTSSRPATAGANAGVADSPTRVRRQQPKQLAMRRLRAGNHGSNSRVTRRVMSTRTRHARRRRRRGDCQMCARKSVSMSRWRSVTWRSAVR